MLNSCKNERKDAGMYFGNVLSCIFANAFEVGGDSNNLRKK
jgi:hypothetical protein